VGFKISHVKKKRGGHEEGEKRLKKGPGGGFSPKTREGGGVFTRERGGFLSVDARTRMGGGPSPGREEKRGAKSCLTPGEKRKGRKKGTYQLEKGCRLRGEQERLRIAIRRHWKKKS